MADLEPLIAAMWEKAAPWLAEALEHCGGTHQLEDILEGVTKGELQLWLGENFAAVSQIMVFPRQRVLNMFLAGGDLNEMTTIQAGVEAFARGHACQRVQAGARLTKAMRKTGWGASFHGFQPRWVQFTKDLT